MIIKRKLDLQRNINSMESFFVLGPRGSGKSTWINETFAGENISFLHLDLLEGDTLQTHLTDVARMRREIEFKFKNQETEKLYVFIDEVQKIPALLDECHKLIEKYKGNICFALSGSSARKLKKEQANLLGGRASVYHLFPFSYKELNQQFDLLSILQYGSLPKVILQKDCVLKEEFLRAYTNTYLREEIIQESLIRKIEPFARFLEVAAQNNGEIANFSNFAKDCNVRSATVASYYQILIDTLIAIEIPGWHRSVRKQIQKASRFYFFDCGVLNAIRKELRTEINLQSKRSGKLFETFLIQELFRLNSYYRADYSFYHWRTSHNLEVDLILQKQHYADPIAIEIKASSRVDRSDLKHLFAFNKEEKSAKLYCFCLCDRPYEIDDVLIMPWREGIDRLFQN